MEELNTIQSFMENLPWHAGLSGIGLFFLYVIIWGMVVGASIGSAVVFGWLMWVARWWIISIGAVVLVLVAISTFF